MNSNSILRENEKRANLIVAKVMASTFVIFTVIFMLNVTGIFDVQKDIMTAAYVFGSIFLLTPAFRSYVLEIENERSKYINVVCSVFFVTSIAITLTYHVVAVYVYPIAIASLYFSKRLNVFAASITVIGVSIAQIVAFYVDTLQDDNFVVLYDTIVWGIIPRAMCVTAVAIIFTMLCSRTVALLTELTEAVDNISRYHREMVLGFATLVENKDGSTGNHIKRTTKYVNLLADELRKRGYYEEILTDEYIKNLGMAAPMHDIGKISVPDIVLQKPGKLTPEEFEIIKQHSSNGGKVVLETFGHLEDEAYTKMAYEVARYHHEKWNGKGYPEGLSGDEIPLSARIMAIADVFDAVSEKRCYRDAMPLEQCFEIIENGRGTDFEPELVDIFMDCKEELIKVHNGK